MATKESIAEFAAQNNITMTTQFVPFSVSRNFKPNAKLSEMSLNWQVTILHNGREVLTTDYSAGIGHCPSDKEKDKWLRTQKIIMECEKGFAASDHYLTVGPTKKRIVPHIADVLYSLSIDTDVLNFAYFEEWASDFGYEEDSRKAEAIYNACRDIAIKLHARLGAKFLNELREAVQDY